MTTGAAGTDRPAPGPEPEPEPPTWATPAGPMISVHVLQLPVPVMVRAQEHAADLTRELTLIGESMRQRGDHAGLPARLVALVEHLSTPYSPFTVAQEEQLADAQRRALPSVDLTYTVPRSAAQAAEALGRILDEADDYCREGQHLLTLATPDDLVVYRRWYLGQFVTQADEQPPEPWPQYAARHGAAS